MSEEKKKETGFPLDLMEKWGKTDLILIAFVLVFAILFAENCKEFYQFLSVASMFGPLFLIIIVPVIGIIFFLSLPFIYAHIGLPIKLITNFINDEKLTNNEKISPLGIFFIVVFMLMGVVIISINGFLLYLLFVFLGIIF